MNRKDLLNILNAGEEKVYHRWNVRSGRARCRGCEIIANISVGGKDERIYVLSINHNW